MNKYRAVKTELNGIMFASKREAARYRDLLWLQEANAIERLECQPSFKIEVKGKPICKYIADFSYIDRRTGEKVYEDVKGVRTRLYRLKKKLVEAIHDVEIIEI
jgi:hypothetical protein